jgi:cysteine desulfurase
MNKKRIYLDYASTTPLKKEVIKAMSNYWQKKFGNPSSLHSFGQEALKAISISREKIKRILQANTLNEIIFTSSATESNNLAIKGIAFYYYFFEKFIPHIITSSIEHPSVLEILADLEEIGVCQVSYLQPEKNSLIDPDKITKEIKENTVLITLHYVNSELGTIQKIKEIGSLLERINQNRKSKVYFHTDAAQAGFENLNIKKLKVDLMTISAHKIYGPKGIALLFKKNNVPVLRQISGSLQEYGLRAGTENVALIVGFAKALEIVNQNRKKINNRLKEIRNYFLEKIKKSNLKNKIFLNTLPKFSSPKILNLFFKNISSQELLIYLDKHNIAVSVGPACQSRASNFNYAVEQVYGPERSKNSLRISFGTETTKEEIDRVFDFLTKIL